MTILANSNGEKLLGLYDRLTGLIEKLPGGLHKPILKELVPIREVFLDQRPARLLLLGGAGKSVPEFLHDLCGSMVETGESHNGWRSYRIPERGEIQICDARSTTPDEAAIAALAHMAPDVLVFLREADGNDLTEVTVQAGKRAGLCSPTTPLVGVAYGGDSARARLSALLGAERNFSIRPSSVCLMGEVAAETICAALPNAAKLEFARFSGARTAQAQISGSLLKSFTAVCGVIGLQPIPLADMPVLTALQTLMVGLIIHTTGKPVSARLITEFLGALGLSIGAGMVFRESARALIKVVPFWGNAVSGIVAGAGTYAVGRAAIAYFIEETPIHETRKLFQNLSPSWDAFKRRRLPRLMRKKEKPASLPPPTEKDQ